MKIECTVKEKDLLMVILVDSSICPFNYKYCRGNTCKECFEKHVEWKIKEGESK